MMKECPVDKYTYFIIYSTLSGHYSFNISSPKKVGSKIALHLHVCINTAQEKPLQLFSFSLFPVQPWCISAEFMRLHHKIKIQKTICFANCLLCRCGGLHVGPFNSL